MSTTTWNQEQEVLIASAELGDSTGRDAVALLVAARKRAFDAEQHIRQVSTQPEPDCGSNSCIFSAKGGMRTNGPCRCMENAGFHGSAVMAAKQMLREVLLLRARLDAMPHDRTWTKDKPTPGKWWVSLAPEKRMGNEFLYSFGAGTFRASVYKTFDNDGTEILMARRENRHPAARLTDAIFDGAQWMRNEDPADPFAESQPSYSQDNDLP